MRYNARLSKPRGRRVSENSVISKKGKLQGKKLSKLRTLSVVKGPGNFTKFKPPVDIHTKKKKHT
jgi:hypothetical protein